MSYIDIKNLSYRYPESSKPALENINFQIEQGELILVLGNSGSGKSTLAKCISRTVPNFYGGTISGQVFLRGQDIDEMNHKQRSQEITMVFQDPERQLVMDIVHREIAFGLENVGTPESQFKRKIWESLQFLGISDLTYRDINTLSGGQKQKVAIASAIAYIPKCIILDEPTSQLDPAAAEEIINVVKKINEELGITVIVIEQKVGKWFDYADKISVLRDGGVTFHGDRNDLYAGTDEYARSFMPSYLKLTSCLKISQMPKDFKEARKAVRGYEIKNNIKENYNASMSELIEIQNITCKYEQSDAIKNLSFILYEKDFLGIIGANGSGKSTLLKAVLGLIKYSGSIKLKDKGEIKKLKLKELAQTIGYVSQNPNDYISKETVYDELKFTLDNFKLEYKDIIEETLKALDIYHLKDVNPRDTSGGERQRIAIASILVLRPKLLLLDEPTRGLDGNAKKKLGEILKKLNTAGTTVVMITHDMDFAAQFCSRFLLMFDGQKASEGNAEEVLGSSIYYTTAINKLLRDLNNNIFTLEQAVPGEIINEKS
jgi:energy-coupling factor transport system ATP-binding protein